MQEGEPGFEAYVILSGKVEVTKTIGGKKPYYDVTKISYLESIGSMNLRFNEPSFPKKIERNTLEDSLECY